MTAAVAGRASAQGFLTETFGNAERCRHRGTLTVRREAISFDLASLPRSTRVLRAVLRVPREGHRAGQAVRVVPVGLPAAAGLPLRPPYYVSFDATAAARAWVADPDANRGLRIERTGGVGFGRAVLEVSYRGGIKEPVAQVTGLAALHQAGQIFLTWEEIEDPVGEDDPAFADFEERVLEARARREIAYRVYRHDKPITPALLGEAELVAEIPEVVSSWNLKAIHNTEHPNQGTKTKRSPLRPGYNLALDHAMGRYRIVEGAEPLPRGTGLAVLTTTEPGRRYYAVTASVNGCEAVDELGPGASLREPVDEEPAKFPAIVYQRSRPGGGQGGKVRAVDAYSSWLGPPYHNVPVLSETFIVRWRDLPRGSEEDRLPLWITTGHYGDTATSMGSPGWHGARHYVKGAFTVGVTEGSLWHGFHECMGTLLGYGEGVVHNYPQRRVLGAARWAMAQPRFFVDPERVCIYGQFAAWALRHGDVFAAVMSNGHGNPAIGKEPQKHGWKWGPYPAGSKNWLGIDQWEYMDLPKWIRENPTTELPFWICHPAYGAYPAHTVGDFGFMPWPEMLHAMASTRRAFAANWSSNGPGPVGPLYDLVTRIKLHQSLPAFSECSLDASPGDGDHADAERGGGINVYQLWEPETVTDEPDRWEVTVHLRDDCPYAECTTSVTPRRCREFRPRPGEKFAWSAVSPDDGKEIAAGVAVADEWGLVTVRGVALRKEKRRLVIRR